MLRVSIRGREFTLSWPEFEKMLANTGKDTCVEIIAFAGGVK